MSKIPENSTVLDIGCAQGYLDEFMSKTLGCTVYGVDIDDQAVKKAKLFCESVMSGDVEELINKKKLWDKKFDVILLADVLEHFRNPSEALTGLKRYLNPGGIFIISLPNVAHFTVRFKLMCGNFTYTDTGILDNTHLQFFTVKTMKNMFKKSGLEVLSQTASGNLACLAGRFGLFIDQLWPGLLAVQVVSVLKKGGK